MGSFDATIGEQGREDKINEDERRRREHEFIEVMREYFADPHPDEPVSHSSSVDDE